jgi:hypothetical protein
MWSHPPEAGVLSLAVARKEVEAAQRSLDVEVQRRPPAGEDAPAARARVGGGGRLEPRRAVANSWRTRRRLHEDAAEEASSAGPRRRLDEQSSAAEVVPSPTLPPLQNQRNTNSSSDKKGPIFTPP